jgi:hypothetical protein
VLGGASPLPRPVELLRALRHPDVSIVIDLSHTPQSEKTEYLRTLLPALATLRRHTGLPHRIVVDEAHYFLDDPDGPGLLDFDLNGYTLVSYQASRLHPDVLAANQAIVATRESNPEEIRALFSLCQPCRGLQSQEDWAELLGHLTIGEAVVLPITDEAEGNVRKIRLTPRLTPHVRHLAKYVDIPVPDSRAFVFWADGRPTGERARTLRDFVTVVQAQTPDMFGGHLRRGDFSRWIAAVFGDYTLGKAVRQVEERYRRDQRSDIKQQLVDSVRTRYDFLDPVLSPADLSAVN